MNPFRLPNLMIVMLFLLFAGSLQAQSRSKLQDVLYLKNGWVIRGWVLSDVMADSLRIETEGGNIFVFAKDNVRAKTEEPLIRRRGGRKPYVPTPVQNGYYGSVQFALLAGSGPTSSQNIDITTVHGYRLRHWLAIGGGMGITFTPQGVLMPVFAELRSLTKKTGPAFFGFAKAGYSLALYQQNFRQWGLVESKVSGGIMGELGAGIRIPTARKMAWIIGVGYRSQQNQERFTFEWNEVIQRTVTYQRILVSLGIEL